MSSSLQRRRGSQLAAGLAGIAFVAACEVLNPKSSSSQLQSLLNDSEKSWTSSAIHNYEYDFQHSCDNCVGDSVNAVHVVVRNDVVSSVVVIGAGTPSVANSVYPTVPGIFSIMQAALNSNSDLISATFDATIGYPLFLQILPKNGTEAIGNAYSIANFKSDTL